MKLITNSDAPIVSADFPNTPSVSVLFTEESSPDLGMVRVTVPSGAGMPPHRHSGSDVILAPMTGAVRISKDEEVVDVGVGQTILILKDETVALDNPHEDAAEVIVAAGPAAFVSTVRSWPEVSDDRLQSA